MDNQQLTRLTPEQAAGISGRINVQGKTVKTQTPAPKSAASASTPAAKPAQK